MRSTGANNDRGSPQLHESYSGMVGLRCAVDMTSRHGSPCLISSSSSMGRPLSCTESETLFRMQDHELLRMPLPGGRVPVVVDERPCTGESVSQAKPPSPLGLPSPEGHPGAHRGDAKQHGGEPARLRLTRPAVLAAACA